MLATQNARVPTAPALGATGLKLVDAKGYPATEHHP